MIKKIKQVTQPVLEKQTLYQFTQLKTFVDACLKEAVSKNFETDGEKVKYLYSTLLDVRDFMLTQINENALRASLIQKFIDIETEELMGNSTSKSKEKSLSQIEENLEQDHQEIEIKNEVAVESTSDS